MKELSKTQKEELEYLLRALENKEKAIVKMKREELIYRWVSNAFFVLIAILLSLEALGFFK